ncbi:hypothetical protein DFA_11417 [Cavenderia fasciculata]|uniref:NadR/Ttd14 AAA domain-containing protein n=1 Tax=Cavenderia fasciculata TaxID=261658 RepID=F4QCS4_CACFS|nr:uncharacterized protein DFA_11417 [Cavenderia fasciculata]EGG13656.1 hypothetical protein DFA_11417 [Cavenderia fasciculata]|eukprot:XP_004350360.1 hypothetical protein DFA_11417 [Cavenderia fasciculata]
MIRCCLIGGESTYKTTIAKYLTEQFKNSTYVAEYAIDYFSGRDLQQSPFCSIDFVNVAKGQYELEELGSKQTKILFCDTNPLCTLIWSKTLIGSYDKEIDKYILKYDICLLLDCQDVVWDGEGELRLIEDPENRKQFQNQLIEQLESRSIPYHHIKGKDLSTRQDQLKKLY